MAIPKLNKETNLFKAGAIPRLIERISKAQIEVTADGINSTVSKKVGVDEIISRINQTAEAIKIAASKIDIAGTITAINGDTTTTIDGGKITAESIVIGKLATAVQGAIGKASDYLTTVDNTGVLVHPANDSTTGWRISSALELLKGGVSYIWAGIQSAVVLVRVGLATAGHVVMSGEGYVDVRNGSTVMAHFGYGEGAAQDGGADTAPYYTLGTRDASAGYEPGYTTPGNYSVAQGVMNIAHGFASHAEGAWSKASGDGAHAEGSSYADGEWSHAEGFGSANGDYSHAEGNGTSANGDCSHAGGIVTVANGDAQTVIGRFNDNDPDNAFEIGNGNASANSNAFTVDWNGNGVFAGSVTAGGQALTRTRVKGGAETAYRTGDVNLTPANIGAATASHSHTPASIGAATAGHTHTPTSIGAAAASHTHGTGDITSGTLSIARGGTGKGTADEARSALGAAAATWTSVASTTGVTAATLDLSDYSEVCIVARHGTNYLGSVTLPKAALHASTLREVYLGGWGNNSSGSNRRAVAKVSRASIEPVSIRVDNTDYTDSSAIWTVYAR